MAKGLDKEILKKLVKKTGNSEMSVRVSISDIRRKHAGLTLNAAGQVYAEKKGISVMQKLDDTDRVSLSHLQTRTVVNVGKTHKYAKKRGAPHVFLKFEYKNRFQEKHLAEVNGTYNAKCYTATFILCRKMLENLLIDLLIKKFPENNSKNRQLYFNINQRRFHDFSVILDNLYKKRISFPATAIKPIERLYKTAKAFAKEANDHTHSWFYITTKRELEEINVQEIFDLIQNIDLTLSN